MKNSINVYDIDGKLIRAAGDTHEITIEEAQARVNEYKEKLSKLEDNDENALKIGVYKNYIINLQKYMLNQYLIHPELLPVQNKATEDQVNKAMEELKTEIENSEKETVMDEYVEFEEDGTTEGA